MAHTSPVRLLLLICVTIGVTHASVMLLIHRHTEYPVIAQSLIESAVLVLALFPALYIFSFRPLIAQFSEREQAETVMRESEHKYRHLFNCLGDAAFLIDLQTGRVIDANQQAEDLLGRPRAEILGRTHEPWLLPERADDYRVRLGRCKANGAVSFESEVQAKDGRRVPVHVSSAPLALFGHELVVSLFRDISKFKILHAELLHAQRLESVGALASGIAHDLNNALTPILFATSLLRVQARETSDPQLLNTICSSAARAIQIVRQMLTFVRGGERHRTNLQLGHLVRETADMARVAFPKSIQIHQHLPNGLWTVNADSVQLSQVLMNLAVNARDAMPIGGELSFSAENYEVTETGSLPVTGLKTGAYVLVGVTDTGCGIRPEIKDKIFDAFFTTKPIGQGTGLGLAMVREIVTDHDGFIQVVSHPGQGTEFRIFIPANSDGCEVPAATNDTDVPRGHGELVIAGDDEKFILDMARLALESAGYRVLQARDGNEALAPAGEHKKEGTAGRHY